MIATFKYFKIRFEHKYKSKQIELKVSHHYKKDTNLEVFYGSRGRSKLISGKRVYTAMLVIQNDSDIFNSMPIIFQRALIFEADYGLFPSGDLIDLKGVECYMNFMSHPDFKKRSAYSGEIKLEFLEAMKVTQNKFLRKHQGEKVKKPRVDWNKKKRKEEVEETNINSYLFNQPKESLNNIFRSMSG